MIQKDEAGLRKAAMVKVLRSAIRLHKSLEADRVINEILPNAEDKFNDALVRGTLPADINIEAIVQDVLAGRLELPNGE